MPAVYLSPHYDDICFSLGCIAKKMPGTLVNIFSISNYTDPSLGLPSDTEAVSQIRDEEDDRFSQACGLSKINLQQLDSPLRKHDPFDSTNRAQEAEALGRLLRERLTSLNKAGERGLLFCPAGIGRHRDHLITRDAILSGFEYFKDIFEIVFYEDLHYASKKDARDAGLADFFQAARQWGYGMRYRLNVPPQKLDLVRVYRSQFDNVPADLSNFTPADGSEVPHEAVWACNRIAALEQAEIEGPSRMQEHP